LKLQNASYYQVVREEAQNIKTYEKGSKPDSYYQSQSWQFLNGPQKPYGSVVARPIDKRDHYVKRCVAIAGDTLRIVDGEVYINAIKQQMPEHAQHRYIVKTHGSLFGENAVSRQNTHMLSNVALLDDLDIYVSEAGKIEGPTGYDTSYYDLNMPVDVMVRVKALEGVYSVQKKIEPRGYYDYKIFPHYPSYPWNNDNFGPLLVPRKGMTVPIDTHNICMFEKIINTYDDGIHQVVKQGGQVLRDGVPITSYTFLQDYYFMMGDNRHNSADSRSWGYVPFDHIVGSPFFVWFSMKYEDNNPVSGKSVLKSLFRNSKEGKFRWERFLCYVENGKLHSIKIPFVLSIVAIWALTRWQRKRKQARKKPSPASVK
jgi:signal peptidase I